MFMSQKTQFVRGQFSQNYCIDSLLALSTREEDSPFKNGQNNWTDISKKIRRWLTSVCRDAQHY